MRLITIEGDWHVLKRSYRMTKFDAWLTGGLEAWSGCHRVYAMTICRRDGRQRHLWLRHRQARVDLMWIFKILTKRCWKVQYITTTNMNLPYSFLKQILRVLMQILATVVIHFFRIAWKKEIFGHCSEWWHCQLIGFHRSKRKKASFEGLVHVNFYFSRNHLNPDMLTFGAQRRHRHQNWNTRCRGVDTETGFSQTLINEMIVR